jgi:spore coat protein CotF
MSNYKADITLNEKDSLQDMLNLEKALVKIYSTAITEGCSKGFRTLIKDNLSGVIDDQIEVFFMMKEHGYYQVESAMESALAEQKQKFNKVKNQLA